MKDPSLKQEFIQDFGEAYVSFGLPRLMGRIVGLLLCAKKPLSLDKITTELGMSKGPVSQIMRRLRDHDLIQRVWIPGDRKDFYQAQPDIFGIAFRNHMQHMHNNLLLAQKYKEKINQVDPNGKIYFCARIKEMENFYQIMMKHYKNLLDEWRKINLSEKIKS